jgi:chromosomal replication initiation ATPase DnaA
MTSAGLSEVPGPILCSGRKIDRSEQSSGKVLELKVRSVREAVAMVYRIEKGLLGHPTRGRSRVAFARQVAMYLAHVTFGLTLTDVGRAFGRDRTTVSHACALVEDARDNPDFDRTLELVEAIAKRLASVDAVQAGLPAE